MYVSFFFSSATLQAGWTEVNETGQVLGSSAIWKCMSEILAIPSPANRGAKTTFFDDFATSRQL